MRPDDSFQSADDATVVRPSAGIAPEPAPVRSTAPHRDRLPSSVPPAGGNPIVRAANPLLLLAAQLRHSVDAPDPDVLRERAVAGIRQFDDTVARAGVDPQSSVTARYVLCTMLDEAVLESPWGERTGWQRQTLLVTFHGETYGGEKFFLILDRLCQDMIRHADLVELMYLCLALGFGGRYLVEPGGTARLADRREDTYRRLQAYRSAPATELSPRWRGLDRPVVECRALPVWMGALAGVCVLVATWTYLHGRLAGVAEPVGARLAAIGLQGAPLPVKSAAPKNPPADLHRLLADDERSGAIGIDEKPDGQATLRLAGTEMFPSGGADVAAGEASLLARIASALDRVPGRIVVVGHTDDQPIRSLRFKDNVALSAARAGNVGAILARGLHDPRRVETSGAGSSQPVATPVDQPANRARNRRVEILFIPEAG